MKVLAVAVAILLGQRAKLIIGNPSHVMCHFFQIAFRYTRNVISTFDGLMVPVSAADDVFSAIQSDNPSGIVVTRKDGAK